MQLPHAVLVRVFLERLAKTGSCQWSMMILIPVLA
jgi:hypothetical protein